VSMEWWRIRSHWLTTECGESMLRHLVCLESARERVLFISRPWLALPRAACSSTSSSSWRSKICEADLCTVFRSALSFGTIVKYTCAISVHQRKFQHQR
jgi:hypothetical protein